MIQAMLKFVFYTSYVVLLGFVLWQHSSARNWREIADNAQNARDKTAEMAQVALERADRCFAELAKQGSAPVENRRDGKAEEPASPRKSTP